MAETLSHHERNQVQHERAVLAMITITYTGLTHEWVVRYVLEGTIVQTVRVPNYETCLKEVARFCLHEKGVAHGKVATNGIPQ